MKDKRSRAEVCRTFIEHLSEGYHLQPVAHLANVVGIELPKGYVSKSLAIYRDSIQVIECLAYNPDGVDENELRSLVESLWRPTKLLHRNFVELTAEYKQLGRRLDQSGHLAETKAFVARLIESKFDIEVVEHNFDWGKIALFVETFDYWLRELTSTSRQPRHNDFVDLFNLVYVEPGMKYWTKDGGAATLIRGAGLGDCLYP